ncbi:MAG: hypothetical protein RSF40_11620 [Oscillospiraceae bacterium]
MPTAAQNIPLPGVRGKYGKIKYIYTLDNTVSSIVVSWLKNDTVYPVLQTCQNSTGRLQFLLQDTCLLS